MHFLDQSLHQPLDPFEALLHVTKLAQAEWDYKCFKLLDEMMGPHAEEPLETKWEVPLHKDWAKAEEAVHGCPGTICKGFLTLEEAMAFLASHGIPVHDKTECHMEQDPPTGCGLTNS